VERNFDRMRRAARWGMAAGAGAALLGLMTASQAQPVQFHPIDKKPTGCPTSPIASQPGDRKQTVTVKDHAAMDVHISWQVVSLLDQCGNPIEGSQVSSGSKTLTAGFDWSTSYDTATQTLIVSAYSDANGHPYCWENQRMDASKGSVTLTVAGTLFGQSCKVS
jgi:hypothetical protein